MIFFFLAKNTHLIAHSGAFDPFVFPNNYKIVRTKSCTAHKILKHPLIKILEARHFITQHVTIVLLFKTCDLDYLSATQIWFYEVANNLCFTHLNPSEKLKIENKYL